jgi:biopolymer transport protein ExbB/TolQ
VERVLPAGPDYSIYGLVLQADPVVKGVMLLLVIASIATWAIIIGKLIDIGALRRAVRMIERGNGTGSEDARAVLTAGRQEGEASQGEPKGELRDRIERAMREALKAAFRKRESGLPFLATIGSAAPFIGLFGTVWGIVNSFTAIAQQKDTSLAVVAPGIAEALIATALGLAAAIPAVMAYNAISVSFARLYARGSSAITKQAKLIATEIFGNAAQHHETAAVERLRARSHA